MRTRSFAFSILVVLAACGPSGPSGGDDDGDDGDDSSEPDARPWTPGPDAANRCQKMDILFVVDNSGSMGEEQTNLGMNFPGFIDVIQQSGLDYRVAVTSTGVDYTYYQATPLGNIPSTQDGGDNGVMLQKCGMTRRWIEQTDADPSGTFACAATLGTDGPGDEMPLAAMRLALEDRMADGTNMGWRRQDALLAIVILTDENDCSYEQSVTLGFTETLCESQMEPPANYVAFLDQYTGNRARWATAVIAGPGPSTCNSGFGNADYAQRLDEFVTMTGDNAVFSSICEGNLTTGLADALAVFASACDDFPPID